MRLPNLAGKPSDEATARVLMELEACGIPADLSRTPSVREVNARARGCLRLAGGIVVTFDRAWIYYVVQVESPGGGMPLKEARDLHNNSPWLGYDDGPAIRVDGHAAALPPTGPVTLWHVDTLEGLAVIAAHLRMWSKADLRPATRPPVEGDDVVAVTTITETGEPGCFEIVATAGDRGVVVHVEPDTSNPERTKATVTFHRTGKSSLVLFPCNVAGTVRQTEVEYDTTNRAGGA